MKLTASEIKNAIENIDETGYWNGKVYIACLYPYFLAAGSYREVKAQLLNLHQAGQIHLTRCDLVTALTDDERELLNDSEILDGHCQFHFIVP